MEQTASSSFAPTWRLWKTNREKLFARENARAVPLFGSELCYSCRSAIMGWTSMARRAGT